MKQIHFTTIDSTSTYAKTHAAEFDPKEITCVCAEEQTAGKGRFGRPWASPAGVNIYATFCFTLPSSQRHLTSLSQVMTASIASVLLSESIIPEIKWPNDIRFEEKKLCGVLSEVVFKGDVVQVFIGVGLNVNMDAHDLEGISQPATSLKLAKGQSLDKEELLQKIQTQFAQDLEKFKLNGFDSFYSFYQQYLVIQTKPIHFFDGKKEWVGTYHSLNKDGGINIQLPDQSIQTIYT